MNNPFLGYGRVVSGERFIGRKEEIKFLTERILNFSGSLSVVGEHQIGKTSLVKHSIQMIQETYTNEKHTFIWRTLSTISDLSYFYEDIFYELIKIFLNNNIVPKDNCCDPSIFLLEKTLYGQFRTIKKILKNIKKQGYQISLVIDEFDSIRNLSESQFFIQQIRELIDFQDDYGLTCIFISRRSLYHLENQISDISNIDNICDKLFVRPFSLAELQNLFDRIKAFWKNTESEVELLWKYCGGHPYIAEMILCKGWNEKSIELGFQESRSEIFSHYKRLQKLLEEDNIFSILCQLTVGPRWECDTEHMHRLFKYGLVKQNDNRFVTFSDHFQNYLEMIFRQKPLWAVWTKTEILLRDLISSKLMTIYGPDWISIICKKHSGISKLLEKANAIKMREEKLFGNNIDCSSSLDYTYPRELWEIIKKEWPHFQEIFKKEKQYWQERFEFLATIRNPLAHSREYIFSEEKIHLANGYCHEIINLINNCQSD